MTKMESASISRGRIREVIEEIPGQKLPEVLDLEYIKDRKEWETTWEILQDKKFLEGIKRGKKNISERR